MRKGDRESKFRADMCKWLALLFATPFTLFLKDLYVFEFKSFWGLMWQFLFSLFCFRFVVLFITVARDMLKEEDNLDGA